MSERVDGRKLTFGVSCRCERVNSLLLLTPKQRVGCIRPSEEFLIHNWTRLGANPGPVTNQSVTLSTYPLWDIVKKQHFGIVDHPNFCMALPLLLTWRFHLAGMPVGHYQLFKLSLASEAVLPDNRIILLLSPTHFRSCPPLPFPPCVFERVMGTVFACRALPGNVCRPLYTQKMNFENLFFYVSISAPVF